MEDREFIATVYKVEEIEPDRFYLYIEDDTMLHDEVPIWVNEQAVPLYRENITVRDLKPGDKVKIKFTLRREEVKYETRLKPSKIFTMDIIQWYPVEK